MIVYFKYYTVLVKEGLISISSSTNKKEEPNQVDPEKEKEEKKEGEEASYYENLNGDEEDPIK